jgi:CRISPR system Cascade subunit CasC
VCINRELLKENLQNDEELAKKAIEAFMEASTSTTPSGKQNSFASPTRAAYVLAELGNQQPRSLSNAFFNAIRVIEDGEDLLKKSIDSLNKTKENIDRVYGPSSDTFKVLNIFSKESDSLGDLIEFSIGS